MGCGCFGRNVAPVASTINGVPVAPNTQQVVPPTMTVTQVTVAPMAVPSPTTSAQPAKSKGYNVLDVIQDKLTGKLKYVAKDVAEFRLGQCHNCEHLKIGICSHCGCVVEFKTRYEQSVCPVGKW